MSTSFIRKASRHLENVGTGWIYRKIYARGQEKSRETPQMRKYFPSNTLSVSWVRKRKAMTSRFSKHVSRNSIGYTYSHTLSRSLSLSHTHTHTRTLKRHSLPSASDSYIPFSLYDYSYVSFKKRFTMCSLYNVYLHLTSEHVIHDVSTNTIFL
jgi:hypothetical protein